jgi:hypothetical protein
VEGLDLKTLNVSLARIREDAAVSQVEKIQNLIDVIKVFPDGTTTNRHLALIDLFSEIAEQCSSASHIQTGTNQIFNTFRSLHGDRRRRCLSQRRWGW